MVLVNAEQSECSVQAVDYGSEGLGQISTRLILARHQVSGNFRVGLGGELDALRQQFCL